MFILIEGHRINLDLVVDYWKAPYFNKDKGEAVLFSVAAPEIQGADNAIGSSLDGVLVYVKSAEEMLKKLDAIIKPVCVG